VGRIADELRWAWSKARRRLLAAAFVGVAAAAVVAGVLAAPRWAAWRRGAAPPANGGHRIERIMADLFVRDARLGYRNGANLQQHERATLDGRMVYDVVYTTDALGWRATPQPASGPYDRFAIFAGCSFDFGAAVADNETFAARFAEDAVGRKIHVYNHSAIGWGPNHLLTLIEEPEYAQNIAEKRGLWIYLFMDHHVIRARGDCDDHPRVRGNPCYRISHGRLQSYAGPQVRDPSDAAARLNAYLGEHFHGSHFDEYLGPRDRDLDLTAQILAETNRVFRQKFTADGFIVVCWPEYGRNCRALEERLAGSDIRFFQYHNLFKQYADNRDVIVDPLVDTHPNAVAFKLAADELYEDLAKVGLL